ncbi:MAG: nitroreductase [Cellvibrionaceae bacterium]
MDAITALTSRVSVARVTEPGPSEAEKQDIFQAALRAADHANLRPWRFLVLEGEARERLGSVFAKAEKHDDPSMTGEMLDRASKKALRAPLIVVVIAVCQEHPKVPEVEQVIAAGAAAQNMLVAAHAKGVGAYWRTGKMAFHPVVMSELGLADNEQILGFLYFGTPVVSKPVPELNIDDYFQQW